MKAKHWALVLGALYLVVFVGLALVLNEGGAGLPRLAALSLIPFAAIVAFFALLGALLFTVIAVHELGHYVAGRIVGFNFNMAVVGPFGLRTERGRVVPFRMKPAWNGGFMAMSPPDDERFFRRFAIFVLGGPVISLLWLGLVLAIWKLSGIPISERTPPGLSTGESSAHSFFGLLTLMSFTTLVSTLIPYRTKAGQPSDGLRLIEIARKDERSFRLMATLTLQRLILAGVRARDLPPETIRKAVSLRDVSVSRLWGLQIQWAYELTYDRQATGATLAELVALAKQLDKSLPPMWKATIAQIQATQAIFVHHDPVGGSFHLAAFPPDSPLSKANEAVLRAGIAAIEHDSELPRKIAAARHAIEEATRAVTISFDWELEWLDAMDAGWPTTNSGPTASGD